MLLSNYTTEFFPSVLVRDDMINAHNISDYVKNLNINSSHSHSQSVSTKNAKKVEDAATTDDHETSLIACIVSRILSYQTDSMDRYAPIMDLMSDVPQILPLHLSIYSEFKMVEFPYWNSGAKFEIVSFVHLGSHP